MCLGSPSFQKICPWANRFRRLSLPAAEAVDVFEDAQFDDGMFKRLGVNITCEPAYQNSKLYHK